MSATDTTPTAPTVPITGDRAWPSVTVAVPVLNEAADLATCLDAIVGQDYEGPMEVLVVDGGSTDASVQLAGRYPQVRVVDNPGRRQAAGLNVALVEAAGEILVRVDARVVLDQAYVRTGIEALERTGAGMVGAAQVAEGRGAVGRAVARAFRIPVGAGGAAFRTPGTSGWTDTAFLGVFRVDLARAVGGWDPSRATNEDAEFALRIGRHGGVWLDGGLRSVYRPRETLRGLATQYYRYGRGRADTVVDHHTASPRQLVAPALVVGLASPRRRPVAAAYGLVVAAVAADLAREDPAAGAAMVAVLPTMHLSWGIGFLRQASRRLLRRAR